MGLLGLDDDVRLGLLMAGLGTLAGRGGPMRALGQGGLLGMGAYTNAKASKAEQARQDERERLQRMLMEAQIGNYQSQAQEREQKALQAQQQAARMQSAAQGPDWSQLGPLGALMPSRSPEDAAMALAQAGGDTKSLVDILKMNKPEYGMALTQGVGPDGKPVFAQASKQGGARIVPGVAPPAGDTWEPVPPPEGVAPGQYWQRNTKTGQMLPVGSRPPVPAIGSLNVGGTQLERKEQQEKGSLNVKYYGELKTAADAARKEDAILQNMERNPLRTGAGVPLVSTAANWLAYAGMPSESVREIASNSQTFTRDAMDLVLQKQLAQKGPQTESDARRLEQTVAQLKNTPEANAAIIKFARAQNKRIMRQQQFYDNWWRQNKTYEGADEAWNASDGSRSLWDEPELRKIAKPAQGNDLTPAEQREREELRRKLGLK